MTFRLAFTAIFFVLVADFLNVGFGIYKIYPNVDIPLHIAGGFSMAILGLAIIQTYPLLPTHYSLLFTLGFTALTAIVWEWLEFVVDHTLVVTYQLTASQLSLADTLGDLFNGLLGATVCFIIYRKK